MVDFLVVLTVTDLVYHAYGVETSVGIEPFEVIGYFGVPEIVCTKEVLGENVSLPDFLRRFLRGFLGRLGLIGLLILSVFRSRLDLDRTACGRCHHDGCKCQI